MMDPRTVGGQAAPGQSGQLPPDFLMMLLKALFGDSLGQPGGGMPGGMQNAMQPQGGAGIGGMSGGAPQPGWQAPPGMMGSFGQAMGHPPVNTTPPAPPPISMGGTMDKIGGGSANSPSPWQEKPMPKIGGY